MLMAAAPSTLKVSVVMSGGRNFFFNFLKAAKWDESNFPAAIFCIWLLVWNSSSSFIFLISFLFRAFIVSFSCHLNMQSAVNWRPWSQLQNSWKWWLVNRAQIPPYNQPETTNRIESAKCTLITCRYLIYWLKCLSFPVLRFYQKTVIFILFINTMYDNMLLWLTLNKF